MKILLYRWKAYSDFFLENNLKKLGHDVTVWVNDGIIEEKQEAIEELVSKMQEGFEIAFSYNYFGGVAIACNRNKIPYVSWTQDSPLLSLYDRTSMLDTNYFFCFDSEQFRHMKNRKLSHVYYLPLGVDVQALMETADSASDMEMKKYSADISFVGSLYSDRNMLGDLMERFPQYVQGYLNAFLQTQLQIPAVRFSQADIDKQCMESLKGLLNFSDSKGYDLSFEELMDNLLDRQVTVQERTEMLRICRNYPGFKLYTGSKMVPVEGIRNCGTVEYYTEMPKVFRHSKINLNVSLRSIRAGIPLRVLDVIASGGFVLTNAQPDLTFCFEEGKNIVTFQNMREMKEKIEYYLVHEGERKRIIKEGQQVLCQNYDFLVLLPLIFNEVRKNSKKI